MSDIKQPIVIILVSCYAIRGEVTVVNPDVCGVLDFDQVLGLWRIVEVQVAKDNVGLFLNPETTASEAYPSC